MWQLQLVPPNMVSETFCYFFNSFMTESLCKSMDWFLYDRHLPHERVKILHNLLNKLTETELAHYTFNDNFTKFAEKYRCRSLFFNKIADLRTATLLYRRLWDGCFPVNFAKVLRAPFTGHLRATASTFKWLHIQMTESTLVHVQMIESTLVHVRGMAQGLLQEKHYPAASALIKESLMIIWLHTRCQIYW